MLINFRAYIKNKFKNDFLASIVVFLVAIPLCLGISIASGVPPALGLFSGIIGGIIVGYFSGCPLQVSGPAAGLITLVYEIVQKHGIENLGVIVLFAGLIQITLGFFKLGQWFRAVPPSLVQGMLSGIGVLILASQFHIMIDDLPRSNGLVNIYSIPQAILKVVFPQDGYNHHLAGYIGLLTIVVIALWKFVPKSLSIIPAPLIGVLCGTLTTWLFKLDIKHVTIPENLLQSIKLVNIDNFSYIFNFEAILAAFALAFIASTESLLSAIAVDKMTIGHKTNYNKEIISQGIGNIVSGILCSLPITGVIVRSSANVIAGAQTKASAIFHGVWILIFCFSFPHVLAKIPIASLAAILVYTGWKLINLNAIKYLLKFGKGEVAICLITIIAIVSTNLLEGILIGFAISSIRLLLMLSYLETEQKENEHSSNSISLYIKGSATFLNLPLLAEELEAIPPNKTIFIRFEGINYIDHASLDLIANWKKQYVKSGGNVYVKWEELEAKVFNPKNLVNSIKQ